MRFSKKIIVTMFVFLFAFVIVILTLFWLKGEIPDTLITCVFGFFGVEGGCLAMIKAMETKHSDKGEKEDHDNDNESEDNENDGCNTDINGDNNTDNIINNGVPDSVLESEDWREETRRPIKVGVYRRYRR